MNSVFVNTQGLYQRRRAYNMSYRNDCQTSLGVLTPVYFQDLIPNSSWRCAAHGLVRFLPMLAPIMDNIDLYLHFWQAPDRILYGDEFTDMITGATEDWPGVYWVPNDVFVAVRGMVQANFSSESSEKKGARTRAILADGGIFDMLGYDKTLFGWIDDITPQTTASSGKLNARKFIMYIRLVRYWYTNENVPHWNTFFNDTEMYEKNTFLDYYDDGNISASLARFCVMMMKNYETAGFAPHAWPKDYFTSALPTLQYGTPTYLPLGESAPVTIPASSYGDNRGITIQGATGVEFKFAGNDPLGNEPLQVNGTSSGSTSFVSESGNDRNITQISGHAIMDDVLGEADLTEATAVTINELRVANALQVFKEREMRYGRKAPEYYKGFYGVTPGDLRLQLPKFLGGGKMPVNISDVEQTSQSAQDNPLGKLAGKGTGLSAGFAHASTFVAEESVVMGVAWLMPKVTYSTALSRHDTKINDRFQYYNPSFAHIGEQEVFNYELFPYSYGSEAGNNEFGYQPRYTEYRFHFNEMHGSFKSSLSYWTLGRLFGSQPAYNSSFIYMQPVALNRIFAVRTTEQGLLYNNVLMSLYFSCAVLQPLSRYGTPGLLA